MISNGIHSTVSNSSYKPPLRYKHYSHSFRLPNSIVPYWHILHNAQPGYLYCRTSNHQHRYVLSDQVVSCSYTAGGRLGRHLHTRLSDWKYMYTIRSGSPEDS